MSWWLQAAVLTPQKVTAKQEPRQHCGCLPIRSSFRVRSRQPLLANTMVTRKYYIYSGHSTRIVPLLSALWFSQSPTASYDLKPERAAKVWHFPGEHNCTSTFHTNVNSRHIRRLTYANTGRPERVLFTILSADNMMLASESGCITTLLENRLQVCHAYRRLCLSYCQQLHKCGPHSAD